MATILIIDSEPKLRANLRRFLALQGHKVIEADEGSDGLTAAIREVPDLVLCDLRLPSMDGFSVLRAIRNMTAIAAMPFVFLSGAAESETARAARCAGADDYNVKPFELRTLSDVIDRTLAEHGAAQWVA